MFSGRDQIKYNLKSEISIVPRWALYVRCSLSIRNYPLEINVNLNQKQNTVDHRIFFPRLSMRLYQIKISVGDRHLTW